MNAPTTLAAFALGLASVFAGAVGVGAAVGPVGPVSGDPAGEHDGSSRHTDPVPDPQPQPEHR